MAGSRHCRQGATMTTYNPKAAFCNSNVTLQIFCCQIYFSTDFICNVTMNGKIINKVLFSFSFTPTLTLAQQSWKITSRPSLPSWTSYSSTTSSTSLLTGGLQCSFRWLFCAPALVLAVAWRCCTWDWHQQIFNHHCPCQVHWHVSSSDFWIYTGNITSAQAVSHPSLGLAQCCLTRVFE